MTTIAEVPIIARQVPMARFTWVSEGDIPERLDNRTSGKLKVFAEFLRGHPMRWARIDDGSMASSSAASGRATYLKQAYGLEATARANERGGTYHVYARFVPEGS